MPVNRRTIVMRAREMRRNPTSAERKLWRECLTKLPWKFRRQAPCGYYILDFYCVPLSLAIEVDGNQHFTAEGLLYDQARDQFIHRLGIRVLRFTNRQILESFDTVCTRIREVCEEQPFRYRKKETLLMGSEEAETEQEK